MTAANRGIGAAFVSGLLVAGAQRIYAAARNPQTLATLAQRDARVVPVALDITDDVSVQEAAARLVDVDLLVNNAGIALDARLIGAADLSAARQEMEVNYFGLLRMCRAFAPMLAANSGGTLINVLSILARVASPAVGSYSASKASVLSLTQAVRAELQAQGTRVIGVLPGYVDTAMAERVTAPKIKPIDVVRATLDALVLFVGFPSIERSFSAVSSAELSWVLNGYTIVYGALLVPAGRLADRVGRKRVFLASAILFTLASMLCTLAAVPAWLIAARVLQAVGGAMLTPTSLALTLAAFSQERRPVAVALWGAVGALAVVAGPPLGSLVVQLAGWPGIFFLNLPVGLAAVLIGRAIIPESRDESSGALPDLFGIVLLIGGAALLAFGVIQSTTWGRSSVRIVGALFAGALTLVGFIVRSSRVASPALDLTLFRERTFSLANERWPKPPSVQDLFQIRTMIVLTMDNVRYRSSATLIDTHTSHFVEKRFTR